MKNSKKLTIVLLVLAIVTALSAGTLAIYTTTLDNQMQTTVDAKEMFLSSGRTWGETFAIALAPGEEVITEKTYTLYTAKDKDPDTVTEVPIDLFFSPNDDFANIIWTCQGLEISLLEKQGDEFVAINTWNQANPQGRYSYYEVLPEGSNNMREFKLRFKWNTSATQDDNSAAGANAVIGFAVTANQHVPAAQ